jgi:hypothetical protein
MRTYKNHIRKLLAIIFVLFSTFFVISASGSATQFLQTLPTITLPSPISTPTAPTIATPVVTQTPLQQDTPTNKDLLDHFEKVTSLILTVTTIVIGGLGILGSAGLYFGTRTFSELSRQVDNLKASTSEMESTQEKLRGELARAENVSETLLNRYRYLIECRDPLPSVRIRAIQQLSVSNDISVISSMIETLMKDNDAEVRAEAAFALSTLLINNSAGNGGIDALIIALNDKNLDVKLQAIQAIDKLICNHIKLPRKAYVRLEKMSVSKSANKITEACKLALKHNQQVLEGNLINNHDHQNSN